MSNIHVAAHLCYLIYVVHYNAKETPNSSEGLIVAIGISAAEAIGITLVTVGLIGKKKNNKQEIIYPIINKNEYGLGLEIDL